MLLEKWYQQSCSMHGHHKTSVCKKKNKKQKTKNSICKAQHLSEYQITMMYTVNMSQFCRLYFNKAGIFSNAYQNMINILQQNVTKSSNSNEELIGHKLQHIHKAEFFIALKKVCFSLKKKKVVIDEEKLN